jgi:cytoskeletal protein RodZ
MDSVEFFKNVDLDEVSKKTLISKKDLNYIKNEEFDKLSKTKGLGFIKIIEREYKVDFSDKKDKFMEYLKEHGKDRTKEFFIPPPKQPVRIFSKLVAVILLLLLSAGVIYIIYLNIGYKTSSNEANIDKNQIVKEAQDISGIDVNESNITNEDYFPVQTTNENNISNDEQPNSEINPMQDLTKETKSSQSDTNITQEKLLKNEDIKKDTAAAKPSETKDQNQTANDDNTTMQSYTLTIAPKSRIWVGVVDLYNFRKKSYLKDTNITIDKSRDFIVATGHGEFKLFFKDKVLDFNTKNPVRFLVKDGNLSEINRKEFIKLNRGKYW